MFRAEGRQRDGETQGGQGYHLLDATSLDDIVLRGQQTNHKQREAGGGHRDSGAREFKQYGKNRWLHFPSQQTAFHSTTKFGLFGDLGNRPRESGGYLTDRDERSTQNPGLAALVKNAAPNSVDGIL